MWAAMAAFISSASASALRPSCPETRGVVRFCTQSRKDSISSLSGSPGRTLGFCSERPEGNAFGGPAAAAGLTSMTSRSWRA